MLKLKTIVFGLCVLVSLSSNAQQKKDSVRLLQEVIIEQSRIGTYAINPNTVRVDSLTRALASGGSVADMLRKYGFGHVRSYGPGGLATASLRGTGSSHTAVLWNGISLISPLNGQLDLAQVPVGFIDDATIQTGGSASLFGNGSIGGTIRLNNTAHFNEGLKLSTFTNVGSFNSYYQDAGATWSGKNFITSTKVFFTQAENDFKFLNKNVFPNRTEQRQHNAVNQKGLLQQNYWQVNQHHLLSFKFWYQNNQYEVPNATSISRKALAEQHDRFYRTLVGWNYTRNILDLQYQGAFIHHDLNYQDPAINLISASTFNTFINNLEGNFSLKKESSLTTGVNYTWEQGKVDEYGSNVPVRNRIALFSAFKWKPFTRWEIAASIREEIVNGSTTPLAPSITAKVKAAKRLEVYTTLSRSYRIPTFNDLYWKGVGGLGNPDLKPELSIGGEMGFTLTSPASTTDFSYSFKTAVFSTLVNDWIQWNPVSSLTWTPVNIKNVWSRGVEARASGSKEVGEVSLGLIVQYSFTKATNQAIYENGNQNELNKQLIFTPMNEGSITLRAEWKHIQLNIVNSYTGKQYTDNNNNELYALPSYNVTNLWLSKPFSFQKLKATLRGELNNIFNIDYQTRPGYPMPGMNFKIGLTLNFNKPNKP